MKKKYIAILCIILLFIPTALAIGSYMLTGKSPIESGNVSKIQISDLNGKEYTVTSSEDSEKITEIFLNATQNAAKINSLPEALANEKFFKVTFSNKAKSEIYKYYFSTSEKDAYFVDEAGTAYHIKDEDAKAFLASPYSACLYEAATAPLLVVSDAEIFPENISWSYKNNLGDFVALKDLAQNTENAKVDASGAFDFNFSVKPDYLMISIYNGSEELFNDTYENIGSLSLPASAELSVKLQAKWYQDENRDYFGEANYSFNAAISKSAAFYLVKDEIDPGEFVVLTGVNVTDVSKISFSSTPSIDFEPVFFADGKYVRALIPIKCELENKDYVFTVKYGTTFSQELNLKISNKTFKSQTYEVTQTLLNSARSEAAMTEFNTTMTPIAKSSVAERLWDGKFIEGVNDYTIVTGFGLYRTISPLNETYRHAGVDFFVPNGAKLSAVNNGRVIFAGILSHSGNTVVVEHGFGLKSWYCNMSDINVSVGATVKTGDVIGTVGNTGFTTSRVAHIGLSVFDVPVCPYSLWEDGIPMYEEN